MKTTLLCFTAQESGTILLLFQECQKELFVPFTWAQYKCDPAGLQTAKTKSPNIWSTYHSLDIIVKDLPSKHLTNYYF